MMPPNTQFTALRPFACFAICVASVLIHGGCSWLGKSTELEGDESFPAWSQSLSSSIRGKDKEAKPSGMVYDKRSQEIEKNLGGNF